MKWFRNSAVYASVCIGLAILSHAAFAQTTVSTAPVGLVNLSVAAGTGSAPTVSVLSFPLFTSSSVTGQTTGIITGVTANTLTNSSAGWTAGALSTGSAPSLIQITSGSAAGRLFLISTTTANTATTVTLDAEESSKVDLTTLGIATGTDTYALYECDTLLGAFGPGSTAVSGSTVLGSTAAASADVVQLFVNGVWRKYYYNTTSGNWKLVTPPYTVSDNVPIRPDSGVIYSRLAASSLSLTVTGNVPSVNRQAIVANSGISFVSSAWPTDLTLDTSNIASIPGWVSSSSAASADIVQMFVSNVWRKYYFNGTNWKLVTPPYSVSDKVAIPAGTAVILQKNGTATGATTLNQPLPYTL